MEVLTITTTERNQMIDITPLVQADRKSVV